MDKTIPPRISILIAARNEETNIADCLSALLNQDLPKDVYEIWVGNDQSEDQTEKVVQNFVNQNKNVHLLNIEDNLNLSKGKANVLAQLARKSKGEYLLITDADISVSNSWVRGMVESFSNDISLISGVTVVEGKSLFSRLQNAEWIFYFGNGHINSNKGKPVSAIGNNMGITRECYYGVGGYENIPFSVTEDLELFKHVIKSGGKFKTLFEPKVLAYTKPLKNLRALFHQRKRWLTGGFQLPLPFVIGLVVLWSLLPIFILMWILFGWKVFIGLIALKWIIDLSIYTKYYNMINQKKDWGYWLYTPYSLIFNTLIFIYYLLPIPVTWKGRKYKKI